MPCFVVMLSSFFVCLKDCDGRDEEVKTSFYECMKCFVYEVFFLSKGHFQMYMVSESFCIGKLLSATKPPWRAGLV